MEKVSWSELYRLYVMTCLCTILIQLNKVISLLEAL